MCASLLLQVDDVSQGVGAALAAHTALFWPLILQGNIVLCSCLVSSGSWHELSRVWLAAAACPSRRCRELGCSLPIHLTAML
jgi:hypothetical protein